MRSLRRLCDSCNTIGRIRDCNLLSFPSRPHFSRRPVAFLQAFQMGSHSRFLSSLSRTCNDGWMRSTFFRYGNDTTSKSNHYSFSLAEFIVALWLKIKVVKKCKASSCQELNSFDVRSVVDLSNKISIQLRASYEPLRSFEERQVFR